MANQPATIDIGQDDAKKRHRSPNYPAVSLREAVERTGNLWKRDGKAGAPPKIAAVHIGFQSAHGQAMSVLAALKKFGLLEEVKDRLVPSQRAIEILNLPEQDPRRVQALKDAALSPTIYRELFEQHRSTGLPADDVLEAELTTYRDFNPHAVAGFVKDFLDTLEFSGLLENGVLKASDMTQSHIAPEPQRSQETTTEVALGGFFGGAAPKEQMTLVRRYPLDISIPRNLRAELAITGQDLRKEDLERLKKQLDRLIENLADAFED
jgi:hypothetical protein